MRTVLQQRAGALAGLLTATSLALAPAAASASASASALTEAPTPVVVGGDALGTHGTLAAPGTPRLPKHVSASGWLVADLGSGQVLAARDPHGRFAPASTLKTLTALTLLPRLPRDLPVQPTQADVDADGSRVGLVRTVRYPASELFTAMLVVSGNDAANALATAAGGQESTAAAMNAEADRLQAWDTHAVNPSGLDAAGQTSSPYDLALIARAAMGMPDFRSYVATRAATVAAPHGKRFQIYTHDKLLLNYPGALGIKNGYTVRARASFVGAATRDGHTLVVTLMHADPLVWKEAAALLDWGFAAQAGGAAPVGQLVGAPSSTDAAAPDVPGAGASSRSGAAARAAVGGTALRTASGAGRAWTTPAGLVAVALAAGLLTRARLRRLPR